MKRVLVLSLGLVFWIASLSASMAQVPSNNVMLGYSGGAGSLNLLRRIIERDKLWQKYGLNVRSIYFNSGTVLIQAVAGGNVAVLSPKYPAW
jgi:ABC-type nitrate/sulfonate/bicarbonate transport system substrate-binding protein